MSEVLNVPMEDNDADAATIGEYLSRLLLKVWQQREGFSGKRPFGNSGWDWDLYAALGKAGLVEMTFDEFGYIDDIDAAEARKADDLILSAIEDLFVEGRG